MKIVLGLPGQIITLFIELDGELLFKRHHDLNLPFNTTLLLEAQSQVSIATWQGHAGHAIRRPADAVGHSYRVKRVCPQVNELGVRRNLQTSSQVMFHRAVDTLRIATNPELPGSYLSDILAQLLGNDSTGVLEHFSCTLQRRAGFESVRQEVNTSSYRSVQHLLQREQKRGETPDEQLGGWQSKDGQRQS